MFRSGLLNFSKGALAPALWGRIDVAAYSAALRVAENVHVLKYGGVTRRMGTRFVYELHAPGGVEWSPDDPSPRLIPFEYSLDQTYMLVFSQATLHVAVLGGMVLEEKLKITGASRANPVVLTVAFHGYVTGDEVFFRDVGGMVELNGRTLPVTVIDDNHFSVPVDGTGYSAFTADLTGITRTVAPAPPPPPPPVPAPMPEPPLVEVVPPDPEFKFCVVDTTPILIANDRCTRAADARCAKYLSVGDMLWTRPELDDGTLGDWGAYPIENITFAVEPVFANDGYPDATRRHRFWIGAGWVEAGSIGTAKGKARVAKITVGGARTYASREKLRDKPVISHNIKTYRDI